MRTSAPAARLLLLIAGLMATAIASPNVANYYEAEYGEVDGVVLDEEDGDEADEIRLLSLLSGDKHEPQRQAYDVLDDQQDSDDAADDVEYYDYDPLDSEEDDPSSASSDNNDREDRRGAAPARLMNGFINLVPESSWYKGPHICKRVAEYTKEVTAGRGSDAVWGRASGSARIDDTVAQCYETESAYFCRTESRMADGKNMVSTVVLECCEGYRKVDQSCVYVKNLTDLLSTAKRHDGFLFAKEVVKLYPWISKGAGKNITLFAPLDRHVVPTKEGGKRQQDSLSERDGRLRSHHASFDELVPAHVVDGYAFSRGFERDMLIPTHWPSSHIRIGVYDEPKKLITANCLPLKSTDHLAVNGLLHLVDGILTPVTSSIWHRLLNDKRFSRFTSLIAEEFPADKLGLDGPGHYTVFAPTNAAMESAKMGEMCVPRTLKMHILPQVVCSRAVEGKKAYLSVDGRELVLQKAASGTITLSSKANILTADVMATNGVIHIIDGVVRLNEDFEGKTSAEQLSGFSTLLSAIDQKGDLTRNVTLFIPSREAISSMTKDISENALEDPDELNNLIKYHVAPGIITCDKFSYQVNTSLGIPIRMQTYATYPFEYVVHTANCMRIVKKNMRTCRSIVHEVEEVLIPPTKNIIEIIDAHPSLTQFATVLRKSAIYNELTKGVRHYTIYAPDDDAMAAALADDLDIEALNTLVLRHTVVGYKCCAGVFMPPYYTRVETEAGGHIKLLRDAGDNIQMSGDVSILECDAVGTNGVIHVVSKVIPAHIVHKTGRLSFPYYSMP